jgi:hypothetical protein
MNLGGRVTVSLAAIPLLLGVAGGAAHAAGVKPAPCRFGVVRLVHRMVKIADGTIKDVAQGQACFDSWIDLDFKATKATVDVSGPPGVPKPTVRFSASKTNIIVVDGLIDRLPYTVKIHLGFPGGPGEAVDKDSVFLFLAGQNI